MYNIIYCQLQMSFEKTKKYIPQTQIIAYDI